MGIRADLQIYPPCHKVRFYKLTSNEGCLTMQRRISRRNVIGGILLSSLAGLLGACSGGKTPDMRDRGRYDTHPVYGERVKMTGEGGISLGGSKKKNAPGSGGGGIGVNSFLWRASLDTISFMPVNSADPFGGVIITDWHSQDGAPNERFKMNIYILGRALRADGIRVAVFRQVATAAGTWRDAAVPDGTGTKIEDAILTRARQLRNETLQQ